MSANSALRKIPELEHQRPGCPLCGLPMWLTEVEYVAGVSRKERLHFECKACEAKAIIPPL